MAKKIDYTGETVKESISKTMEKVIAYHTKNWREGNELKVRDYAEDLCSEIIVQVLNSIKIIKNEEAFYGYMWAVARNVKDLIRN